MKKQKHPTYRPIVIQDTSNGATFLTRSTAESDRTIVWEDGNTYPRVTVEISSASHPVYTDEVRPLSAEGAIAKFQRKYATVGLSKTKH